MNLQQHIRRYIDLLERADRMFETVKADHGELIPCQTGCDDCCRVYFQLSLIEAFTISGMFHQELSDEVKERVLKRAELLEPQFLQARDTLEASCRNGVADKDALLDAASRIQVPCPLNEEGGCVLYEHRPVTCRLYGLPQQISGRVVTCPRTGFRPGEKYTTVDVDEIQRKLQEYSGEFLMDLIGIASPAPLFFMPTALQTIFDKDFFLSLREELQ